MKKNDFMYACLSAGRGVGATAGGPPLARRARALFASHQLVGNFFHYRTAIKMLGLDYSDVFDSGRLDLDPRRWADFGPLNFHAGPPAGVLPAMKRAVTLRDISYYPPNIVPELKEAAAAAVFGRKCGPDFEVMATEGAQAAMAYALLTFVDPGDEVIITDPGYFFMEPAIIAAGGRARRVPLSRRGWRLDPDDLRRAVNARTRAVIICDPVNPFGTVQRRAELEAVIDIANKRDIVVINNATHGFHRLNPAARHYPMVSLRNKDLRNVLTLAGLSHGFGLAGLRVGFLGGRPELVSAVLAVKSSVTRINMSMPMQLAALTALKDRGYSRRCAALLRRNFRLLEEVIASQPRLRFMARPDYGFFACVDTSCIKASCQELTVALLKRRCAVYPGDGLGDTLPASYLRLNFSSPRPEHFRWLKEALPGAIAEAEAGIYRRQVTDFFLSVGTPRARRIVELIKDIK